MRSFELLDELHEETSDGAGLLGDIMVITCRVVDHICQDFKQRDLVSQQLGGV